MAAFVSTTAEKRELVNNNAFNVAGGVYTRVFTFTIPSTAGATDTCELVNVKIPAGTVILGAHTISSGANGNSTTMSLETTTTTAVIAAATAYATSWTSQAVTTPLATTTAEETLTVTLAVGVPSVTTTITVNLICASLGAPASGQTTYTV